MAVRTNLDRVTKAFKEQVERRLDVVVQETMALSAFAAQSFSPVFTGQFRESWRLSEGSPDTSTSPGNLSRKAARARREASRLGRIGRGPSFDVDGVTGGASAGRLASDAKSLRAGSVAFLTNSVEYADKVNDGDIKTGRKPTLIVQQIRLLLPGFVNAAVSKARGVR